MSRSHRHDVSELARGGLCSALGHNGPFSIPLANSPLSAQFNSQSSTPPSTAAAPHSTSTFRGQVEVLGRLPPSAATDEPVAMGTVNGLGSEDSGPDINTQSLILPAGRQWEKDTGPEGGRRRGDGVHKKMRNNGESAVLYAPKTKQTRR